MPSSVQTTSPRVLVDPAQAMGPPQRARGVRKKNTARPAPAAVAVRQGQVGRLAWGGVCFLIHNRLVESGERSVDDNMFE